ncbi:SIR2 family NAD-dependent protein deacylase [Arthrobacter sp. LAR12-1-1.1]|uniref:SIR2 family NAD-dependent protein deacylase n=1 Tax=Arthrobacter sp. LAR12-1-1.1 TaxID=3135215 RepID=UPI00343EECA9
MALPVRPRYIERLPGGLLRALFAGQWLPIVGAGISRTAATEDNRRPPSWAELGKALEGDVPGAASDHPIEAISAFAELYGRPVLIERLTELLLVDDVEPSSVHLEFTGLPFDTVVTTNADFLLESAYQRRHRPCVPLLGESQLSIARRPEATYLLKFHGDLRHPGDLVMTEDDYDGFTRRRPLLFTYLSWLLLTREPVLFGYSLDDSDLREILALLRDRLGKMSRAGWAILPTDKGGLATKFMRRGLKAIVLDENPEASRQDVLEEFFYELREAWEREVLPEIAARTDATTAELRRA